MADNTVTLVGNLTRDPELRFTTGGQGVASFGLAVNRRYQAERRVAGADVVLQRRRLGQLGENAAASAHQGQPRRSSPAASSSARGRPRTARSAASSRSSPTRSARACAGPGPGRAQRALVGDGGFGGGGGGGGCRRRRRRRRPARQPDPIYGDEEPF